MNRLREDVKRWRKRGYRGASNLTRELLALLAAPGSPAPDVLLPDRSGRNASFTCSRSPAPNGLSATGFKNFEVDQALLKNLLDGVKPPFAAADDTNWPRLVDPTGSRR